MTTIPTPAEHAIADCPWCCAKALPEFVGGRFQVVCGSCGAGGPGHASEAGAIRSWNAVRMFGRVGIVHGRPGVPNHTISLSEHLRLLSEQVAAGVYDAPDAYITILVSRAGSETSRIHASTHNIDAGGVAHACKQVHQSANARNMHNRAGLQNRP